VTGVARPVEDRSAEAAATVLERFPIRPRVALILGSGLGSVVGADALQAAAEIPYADIPGFPPPSVPGHTARLTLGRLHGVPAAVFSGRVHFYEGHGMWGPTLIPRLSEAMGVRILILTNAAGGLDPDMAPGDLMLLTDHINLMGANPLIGWVFEDGTPAFIDLTAVYDRALRDVALNVARRVGIALRTGVYAGFSGPSYETPAEHAMARGMGANSVGMSTVPEAVAGAALCLRMLAITCVTNLVSQPTSHEEVLAAGTAASGKLARLLAGILGALPHEDGQAR
jgi:purine-nucleoside phosphorylase